SAFLQALLDDVRAECSSRSDVEVCRQQHSANALKANATVKDLMHGFASMIDPQAFCGLESPTSEVFVASKLYTNTEFLNCQLCYSLLQFLNTAVAGGQTRTSQQILAGIGAAAKAVCVAVDLPALLHLLVPGLGDLDCDGMPQVIVFVFQYVFITYVWEHRPADMDGKYIARILVWG
ncbi:hypothetical protein OSTOST_18532, partial [Ostertagia ostertagi]